jgi:uncharacterized protein YndB with AHSA1/START domain
MTAEPTTDARPRFLIERTYRATLDEIWSLWTTRDGFESWWGPVGFRVEVRTMEARFGGSLDYEMIADAPGAIEAMRAMGQPISHATHGRFTEFTPKRRLTLTHVIDFVDGVRPFDNSMTVELFPSDDRVRMSVTLGAMPHDELMHMQREGFTSQLSKLDQRFGPPATA